VSVTSLSSRVAPNSTAMPERASCVIGRSTRARPPRNGS
jgi:hypothetical protein